VVVPPRILSLCTGLGGLDLGIEIAAPGSRVVCAVERDAYCAAVLAQGMEQGRIPGAPIWDDLRTFDGAAWRGAVDCVTAGYPCQPFSVAGQKRGADDPRNLWPEVARIVGECAAPLVFLENVARHLSAGFDVVARDLQSLGYTVAAMVCRASTVGAPHQRERLFALAVSNTSRERIGEPGEDLANGNGNGFQGERSKVSAGEQCPSWSELDRCSGAELEHANGKQCLSRPRECRQTGRLESGDAGCWPPGPTDLERWATVPVEFWPSVESPVRGVAHGLPDGLGFRRAQLHALGNAVVPVQAAHAFSTLCKEFR
jgi:DNA (cytosine-5)-methyltransferase 1